jgi:hypothetical protein
MASSSDTEFTAIVERNISSIERTIVYQRALIGLGDAEYWHHGWDFIVAAETAMYYAMFAYPALVFGEKEQAGFWFIVKVAGIAETDVRLGAIRSVVPGLKHIRDKSHFHLDKTDVLDLQGVYSAAGITGTQLGQALSGAYDIHCELHVQAHGFKRDRVDYYTGVDATEIAKHVMEANKG